jgi:hypothetical protein
MFIKLCYTSFKILICPSINLIGRITSCVTSVRIAAVIGNFFIALATTAKLCIYYFYRHTFADSISLLKAL